MQLRPFLVLALVAPLTTALLPADAGAQETDLAALRQAARENRRDADAQTRLGLALLRAGHYRDAERTLKTAARLHDHSIESLYDVARVAFAREDYRRSRAACRQLERRYRGQSLTHVCRARAFLVWNRSGRAFEELERATAAGGDHFEAHLALGDAYRLRAQVSEAEQAYRRAIQANGQRPEPHLGLGLLYANARRTDDAVRALRAALRLDGDDPEIQYELGKLLEGEEARRLLRQAVAGRPDMAAAQSALGELELKAGNAEAAKAAFEAALEAQPRDAAALAGLGQVALQAGEHDEAMARFNQALEVVPNDGHVTFLIGQLHEAKDEHREAYEHYRRAAAIAPNNPEALLAAASLALEQDRDVLASGFLDNLLRVHANLAAGLELYGDAMKARGDRERAREYYQRALRGDGPIDRAAVQRKLREVSGQRRRGRRVQNATRR
jgi:tetratricopeptide (TPR) repeat protein